MTPSLASELACCDRSWLSVQSRHLLERVSFESLWLGSPGFADELVWGEACEGLEASGEVVGVDEVAQVGAQLIVGLVEVAFDGGVFDGAVHSLDLTIGPRMLDLGQPMFDAILLAAQIEHMSRILPSGRPRIVVGK